MKSLPIPPTILLVGLLFVFACISTPATIPVATPLPPGEVTATAVETTPTPQPDANPTVASGSLWLNLLSPLDGALVDVPQIEVVGQAPAGTVVSVNNEILVVGPEGQFTLAVTLVEGPNVIEIVASDAEGTEIDTNVTVIYQP